MRHVCVAIPSKTGMVPIEMQHSIMDIGAGCIAHGMQLSMMTIKYNPYIQHVRNRFIANFIAEPRFTEILFLDDDLSWEFGTAERIFSHDVDVVAGVYPKKSDKLMWPAKPLDAAPDANGMMRMVYVPTGFLRISRRCIEAMLEQYKFLQYREHVDVGGKPSSTVQTALFWLDLLPSEHGGLCMQGEDVNFCMKWREMGGEIWADTTLKLKHHGMNDWDGCYGDQFKEQQIAAE